MIIIAKQDGRSYNEIIRNKNLINIERYRKRS